MDHSTVATAFRHHDHSVDTLRGVAILMVLVLHAIVMTPGVQHFPKLLEVSNHLNSGVQLFFVLSGYVISASMDRALIYGDGRKGFFLRRVAKIVPLYIVFLHLNIGFFWIWTRISNGATFYRNSVTQATLSWPNYLVHLTFVEGFTPRYINTLLDGGWSIACEAYFYALMPLVIHRASRSVSSALWSLTASLVIACLSALTLGKHAGIFGYYAFPAQLPCFLMGIVVFRLRERFTIRTTHAEQIAILGCSALLFVGLVRIEAAPLGGHIVLSIIFSLWLFFLNVRSSGGIRGIVQWVGRQSYSLFLIHIFLLKVAYSVGRECAPGLGTWTTLVGNLLISTVGALLFSWLVFDRIDRAGVVAMSRHLSKRRGLAALRGESSKRAQGLA